MNLNRLFYSWLLTCTAALAQCQPGNDAMVTIRFLLHIDSSLAEEQVFMTGSHALLGEWDPAGLAMKESSPAVYEATLTVPTGTELEYKYTLGAWEREAVDAALEPYPNFSIVASASHEVHDTIVAWKNGAEARTTPGRHVVGTVDTLGWFGGGTLLRRKVYVWLPTGYAHDTTTRFATLYMHDGQNLVDPAMSSFGTEWQVDEILDSLISEGLIPPTILVGIDNTADRSQEYLPMAKATSYRELIVDSIVPAVTSRYTVSSDPAKTLIGGSSAGGTAAFILGFTHPEVFGKVLGFSPAFESPEGHSTTFSCFGILERQALPENLRVYLYNGGVDLESQLQPGFEKVVAYLSQHGWIKGEAYTTSIVPTAAHNEAAWSAELARALLWLFHPGG